MDICIKLDAWFDYSLIRLFRAIKDMVGSGGHTKVAIAPANRIAEKVLIYLTDNGYRCGNIAVYDKDTNKQFPVRVRCYGEVMEDPPDKIVVVSAKHAEAIKERFLSLGVDVSSILSISDFCDSLPASMTGDSALEYIFAEEDNEKVDALRELLDEKDVAIVNCPTFFYDVGEKARVLKRDLGMEILWIDDEPHPIADDGLGMIRANIADVINYIRHRTRKDNILYFSVNPVWRLVVLYILRKAFPELKIILYKYDWLTLFCPYEHKDMLQRLFHLPMKHIESEYEVFSLILKGGIVDGILYKDGGDDIPILKNYPRPKLFSPTYLSERLYQEPVKDINNPNRCVFLGALPLLGSDVELFGNALAKTFSELIRQGFEIDVYEPRSQEVIHQYRGYFEKSTKIRFIFGKPLDSLLPEIAGKYHWGIVALQSDIAISREQEKLTLPSKIFAYLALGVPVIVGDYLSFTAEFVNKNGIGIVIPYNDIKNLGSILSGTDYAQLQRNIVTFREDISLERQKGKFVDFVSSVMKGE